MPVVSPYSNPVGSIEAMNLFTHNTKTFVLRAIAVFGVLLMCFTPSVVHAADGDLVIQNPRSAYRAYERVEFTFGGCSPYGTPRLELLSENSEAGTVVATYVPPVLNAAGFVRGAVLLPSKIIPGDYFLAVQCYTPGRQLFKSSVAIRVVAFSASPQPQSPIPDGVITLMPLVPSPVDRSIAKTGIDAMIIAPIMIALAACGFLNLQRLRRRSNPRWSR